MASKNSPKKRRSKKFKAIVIFSVLFLSLALVYWVHEEKLDPSGKLLRIGTIDKLEVQFQNQTVGLVRNTEGWQIRHFNGEPVEDTRANAKFVQHVLDVLTSLPRLNRDDIAPEHAAQYGMTKPTLGFSLGWTLPSSGEAAILFGKMANAKNEVFAFLPRSLQLVRTKSTVLQLLKGRSALDFRDRRVTNLNHDDVEDLITSGSCKKLNLFRDGDHWVWKSKMPKSVMKIDSAYKAKNDRIDVWLEKLLESKYEKIVKHTIFQPNCKLTLKGRGQYQEEISLDTKTGWLKSTALPNTYKASKDFINLLFR